MNDKYEPLLKFLKSGVDEILYDLVRESVAEIVNLADEKRAPVADAASIMWGFGYSSGWLKHASRETILGSAVEINRAKNFYLQLEKPPVFRADLFGVIMSGELYEPNGDGWSFRKKYLDREKTADAAQWLYQRQDLHAGECFLLRNAADRIRGIARNHQLAYCAEIADNAWIAFDEGGYRDVLRTLGAARIQDYAEQAKARRSRNESRKMLGVLNIEGYSEHGQRVKVKVLPVYELFNLDPESEIIKVSAKVCGITSVTSASFSSGPGIYQ